jgi:rhodanese-related sulfurtransferase
MLALKTQIEVISKEELFNKLNNGSAIEAINVLNPDFYYLGFIRGSKRIPFEDLDQRLHELDHNKEIVTYSAHEDCISSGKAAAKLVSLGFRARSYEGGIKEWREAGLPMEFPENICDLSGQVRSILV